MFSFASIVAEFFIEVNEFFICLTIKEIKTSIWVYLNYILMRSTRTQSGRFKAKRADTEIGTIEKKYNVNLGVRSDMKLGTYLEKKGFSSLSKLLNG